MKGFQKVQKVLASAGRLLFSLPAVGVLTGRQGEGEAPTWGGDVPLSEISGAEE